MIVQVNVVLNRTVVDTDYVHPHDHAQPAYKIPFVVYCFLIKLQNTMINRIHFNTRTRGSLQGGGGGAYNWVNVLFSGKWAYNWGVFVKGGGVYMAIYGIVYGGKCI